MELPPLVVSLANTAEPLFTVNRSGNRPSHEQAAAGVKFVDWSFDRPLTPVFADLPSGFSDGQNIPIYGEITATVVPEPSALVMGGTAVLIGLGYRWRRRKRAIA